MIKTLIGRLLGGGKSAPKLRIPLGERVEVAEAEHGIDASLLDDRAVKVVRTLQEAGFEAYIVGGAVRDLLVGLRPKDFDVATNATPEEVKALFRRAFIIGRRFRIVHVIFGRGRDHEVVEVSTFRAYLDASAAEQVEGNEKTSKTELVGKSHVVDASGRVLRDNVWGPQIEDAARRDFTINALYYDPTTRIVVDYHGGVRDVKKRLLRIIGNAELRYREDPVRMIRVVRFAAKLGFEIEARTREPIARMLDLLENVPVSRMFDEMIKLLQTGHALRSLDELRKQGMHRVFPLLQMVFDADEGRERFIRLALEDTDRRVAEGRAVAPSFMLACMLWHDVQSRWAQMREAGEPPVPALQQAIDAVFDARIGDISGRGKLAADMREIWLMQPRFDRRTGNAPFALVEQPRFRAGYDFLRLRADVGQADADLAEWWEDFALGTAEEREALVQAVREAAHPQRRKRGGGGGAARGAARQASDTADAAPAAESESESGDAPARKRRRRRRKPSGAGGSDAVVPEPPSSL
ncbi:polynucleotide adenylyltransferase PcnB [uncultured Azohydromonas sp.]|uniref:polynucleotide adenylyltransferase PcnB n=1 Tax=uncultured Azohydromonas sp. TaxID=487342 RepID=UPI0026161197|nr:polynucleotide adenylyltransferase PcnB [uncultured Azohydromonas sp.]